LVRHEQTIATRCGIGKKWRALSVIGEQQHQAFEVEWHSQPGHVALLGVPPQDRHGRT
jgi:hypothetical protein